MTEREKEIDDASKELANEMTKLFKETVEWAEANPSPQLKERLEAAEKLIILSGPALEAIRGGGNFAQALTAIQNFENAVKEYNATKEG